MANTIINEAPQELPNPSLDIGYTRAVLSYGPSSDEDITNLAVWLETVDGIEAFYKPYEPSDLVFRLESLEQDTAYSMVAAYQDAFVSSVPELKADRESTLINAYQFDPFGVRSPVEIINVESRSSDLGQVGSPPNSIAIFTEGSATEALIDLLEVSEIPPGTTEQDQYPWESSRAIFRGSVEEGDVILITTPSAPFVLRVRSKYRMVDGVVDTSPAAYYGTSDNPVEESTVTPPPLSPTDLNIQGVAVTGGVESYNAILTWDYEASTGQEGLFRNALVSYRVVGSTDWVEETALSNTHTFIGVPFRKQLEFRVKVNGWNNNESDELIGYAYLSNLASDTSVDNYVEVIDDSDIPSNTNVQIGSGGIRGFSDWDGTSGTLVFFLDADTGNLTLGETPEGGGVAPLTFNAATNRLYIKGETITDSIVSADYVMGWLSGDTPTFRTANRTAASGYDETTSGIWMGYEDSSTFKFSLGDSAQYIKWDGSTLKISGDVEIGDTGSTINQKSKYVQVYRRATSTPAKPTGGSYDSPVPSGWSLEVPTYNGNSLYTTYRTFTTDTLAPQDAEWADVSELTPAVESAKLVQLTADSQVFVFDQDGNADKDNVTITATTKNVSNPTYQWTTVGGNGTVGPGGDTYVINKSDFGLNSSIEVSVLVPNPTGDDLTDTITVLRVQDGIDGESALSAYLTNEAHTVASDTNGDVSDFTDASGYMIVYYGSTNITSLCTFSIVNSSSGMSGGVNTNGGYYTNDLTSNSGTLTIRATHPVLGSIDKIFSLSKSNKGDQGDTGATGDSAPIVRVSAESQAFRINKSGTPDRTSITITASTSNIPSPSFSWSRVGGIGTSSNSGNTYTLTLSEMGTDPAVTITVSVPNPLGGPDLVDTVTVVRLEDGADGADGADGESNLVAYLTNESHTLAANSNGNVTDFSGAGGSMVVYYGLTEVTSGCNFSIVNSTAGTVGSITSTGQYSVDSLTVAQGAITFRAYHPNYGGINKIFSVSKSIAGQNGQDGQDGPQGYRGPGRYSVAYGGAWPSSFNNTLAQVCANATIDGTPMVDDVVTVYSSSDPSLQFTVIFLGGSAGAAGNWDDFELTVHGNAIVDGTIVGDKIVAGTRITAPEIIGGYLQVGSAGTNQIVLDSQNSTSPLTVTDPSGNLLLGWANNKFHFDGSLGSGKIDSMSVFTQEVRDIINPPVQGSLGGTFSASDVNGNSTSSISTQISPFIANTRDVTIGCSVRITDPNAPRNPARPVWTCSIQRSVNGGGWTTVNTTSHTADYISEPGAPYSEISYSASVAYTDSPNISEQDTLAYRAVFSRSSGWSGVVVSIRDMSVSQAITGGGLEGHATSASFPYLGLINDGGAYPVIEVKNNPTSSDWIRTPSGRGIIPFTDGNGSLGTATYKFASVASNQYIVGGSVLTPSTGNAITVTSPYGYISLGPQNTSTCHIYTDRQHFTFNKSLYINSEKVLVPSALPSTVSGITSTWGFNSKVIVNDVVLTSDYFETASNVSMVGNYAISSGAKQIIWTIGSGWTSTSNNYGIAYEYADGTHQIHFDNNGTTGIRFNLGGYAYFAGLVDALDVRARSDIRVKDNIVPIGSALDRVSKLGGYTYYRTDAEEVSAGVIAQEVREVLPQAVSHVEGMLVVKPMALIGLLVSALNEEREARNAIEARLSSIEEILANKNPPN